MRVQLVLADDWELRGDGSGNMRAIQFRTMRDLTRAYERHGLSGSFSAEILQQLAHLQFGEKHQELRDLALEWEEVVREVYSRGHDVQLHIHPQWSQASYRDGRWELRGSWSLLNYSRDAMTRMLTQARDYLESLLRPLDPGYRCVSFRSGSWSLAPSADVLPALVDAGIVFDFSMTPGLFIETERVQLDYRKLDERFLPYFPRMDDARRLSPKAEPIVCVPTHAAPRSRWLRAVQRGARRVSRLSLPGAGRAARRYLRPSDRPNPDAGYSVESASNWGKGSAVYVNHATDLAHVSPAEFEVILRDVRRRADASGWELVPVILGNHTKDIGDVGPLERIAARIARDDAVEVLTLTQLAKNLESGTYPVRYADHQNGG